MPLNKSGPNCANLCFALLHQTTKQTWTHTLQIRKPYISSVFWDTHPKRMSCHQNQKKRASITTKVQTGNFENEQFQTNQKVPKTTCLTRFNHNFTPKSSEAPVLFQNEADKLLTLRWTKYYFSKRNKGAQVTPSQRDILKSRQTGGFQRAGLPDLDLSVLFCPFFVPLCSFIQQCAY